jgi:N-acetylneuraminic acid mutarotase
LLRTGSQKFIRECYVTRFWLSALLCLLSLFSTVPLSAQQNTTTANAVVPQLVNFSGALSDVNGKPLSGVVGVTFSLYKDQQGGAPLWVETQNVQLIKSGHYSVMLGSTSSAGLPADIFVAGEARWLGVQAQGQAEQPRVMLLSVPYALKAADAQTIGGLPPSAFVLAAPNGGGATSASSPAPTSGSAGAPPTGGSGTMNYIPIWTDSSGDLGNSVLYQTSKGMVGISTTTPTDTLDVGTGNISIDSGNLNLPATGGGNVGVLTIGGAPFIHACCANSAGNTSIGISAGAFNGGSQNNTAVGYQVLANTSAGNNTGAGYQALASDGKGKSNTAVGYQALYQNTSGNLNTAVGNSAGFTNTTAGSNNTLVGAGADVGADGLTFATAIGSNAVVNENNALVLGGTGANAVKVGIGTATPAATLDVQGTGNFTGLITFAPNQTFPGTGSGTVTSVGSGAGLTGGPITSSGTLSIATAGVTNAMLANPGLTVSAGTDLTGGGGVILGGSTTLNLDTTKVPQLGTANSFAATQTVNGNLALTGSGNGVQFPDGTLQTTAATGGGGIPSGFMILGSTSTAPPGYTLSGTMVSGNVASSVAPMPTVRDQLGVATVSGKIYAIGGYNPAIKPGYLNVNEVYDPSTNSWSTKAPMATRRAYFAAAAAENGKIYAIGGTIGVSILKFVEVYDPVSNTWSTVPALPGAREGLAAAVYLNDIYAIGGFSSQATYLSDLLVFTGSSWGRLKPMPSGRAYLAAATVNGKIYAIGGYDGHSVLDTVEVYDTQHNTWTAAAPMPTARRDLAAVVLNNKIYAIGGSDGQSSLNLVEVYDPSTNIWSTAPSPLAARQQFGAVTVNGFVYLMGGIAGTSILGTVEQYSPPQTLYTFTKN